MDDLTGIFEEQGTHLGALKGCWGRCTRPTDGHLAVRERSDAS